MTVEKVRADDDRLGHRFGLCCLMPEQSPTDVVAAISERPVFRRKIAQKIRSKLCAGPAECKDYGKIDGFREFLMTDADRKLPHRGIKILKPLPRQHSTPATFSCASLCEPSYFLARK